MSRTRTRVIRIQPIGARAPMTPTARCESTGKLRFPDREAAERTLTQWAWDNGWEGFAYRCDDCGGWHATRDRRKSDG